MQTADGGGWTSNTDGNTEITAVDFNHDLCCLVSVYCCNHDEEQVAILTQTPACDPDHVVTDRQVIKLTGTTLTENIVVLKASLEQMRKEKFQQHGAQLLDVQQAECLYEWTIRHLNTSSLT